jgi:hypothetical protein
MLLHVKGSVLWVPEGERVECYTGCRMRLGNGIGEKWVNGGLGLIISGRFICGILYPNNLYFLILALDARAVP